MMKRVCFPPRWLSSLVAGLLLFSSVIGQGEKINLKNGRERTRLSINQQDAFDLMKSLAQSLKGESDKLTAAALQARIADVLWKFDESFAKEVFRWSFDAARQPAPEGLSNAERAAYVARQAAGIREVLSRLGAHDQKRAETWFKALEEEKLLEGRSPESIHFRSELLIQIALQLATSNPEQAQRLGLLSLSGREIPEDFGRLLFALNNVNKGLSDELFRTALAAMRRNDFVDSGALISMINYLFSSSGALHSEVTTADAQLLANYLVDAAWRQARGAGSSSLPESSARFYTLIEVQGFPIVSTYASERLPELQGQMRELASRLTQAQLESTARFRTIQQQRVAVSNRNIYDIEEQIERAVKEKDALVKDSLLNSIAHSLMRSDSERALKVAAMIDDRDVRLQAEDDINLVRIQGLLQSRSYVEAQKTVLKLNSRLLQAKVLAELANKVWAENKDTGRATELLSEASVITSRTEPGPDKLMAFLLIAQQFARFDPIRGFETLGDAIKVLNQWKSHEIPSKSVLDKPRLLTVRTYTVINGSEMSSSDRATLDSIDFSQITPFVTHDYLQTRLLGNKIEHPLRRAKFLIAVAGAMLSESRSGAA